MGEESFQKGFLPFLEIAFFDPDPCLTQWVYYQNAVLVGCQYWIDVMIDRDCWGHLYSRARGEIRGPLEDKLLRKHLPKMFSLIKNES